MPDNSERLTVIKENKELIVAYKDKSGPLPEKITDNSFQFVEIEMDVVNTSIRENMSPVRGSEVFDEVIMDEDYYEDYTFSDSSEDESGFL